MDHRSSDDNIAPQIEALAQLLSRLSELVRSDAVLRQALGRLLAGGVSPPGPTSEPAVAGKPPAAFASEPPPAARNVAATAPPAAELPAVAPPQDRITTAEALRKLDIGSQAPRENPDYKPYLPKAGGKEIPFVPDEELGDIAARSRLKARASRYVLDRRRHQESGKGIDELQPIVDEIQSQASALSSCSLWMLRPEAPSPVNSLEWELVAGSFDALAAAAELNLEIQKLKADEFYKRGRTLLAEATSMLRVAVKTLGYNQPDNDQDRSFKWLRRTTFEDQTHIERFMTLSDPGDPTQWDGLIDRVDKCRLELQATFGRDKEREQLYGKLRYHTSVLREKADNVDSDQWAKVVDIVTTLVRDLDVPPSSVELRERILPVVELAPVDLTITDEFERVLESIDRYLADQDAAETRPVADDADASSPEVDEVRQLLRGRSVVFIGGMRRPANAERLEKAFELARLDWITTREHESTTSFESSVAKPDVAVVVLAIRWSSHSFEGVKDYCQKYDKPFVRLPGGYGVRQFAHQVLEQVGGQLRQRYGGPAAG